MDKETTLTKFGDLRLLTASKESQYKIGLKFFVKLSLVLIMFAILVWDAVRQGVSSPIRVMLLRPMERYACYYVYWTTLSNYLVLIYAAFNISWKYGFKKEPLYNLETIMVSFITTTMIVYWINFVSGNDINIFRLDDWVGTTCLHLVNPIFFIIIYAINAGQVRISYRNYLIKWFPIAIAIPLLYFIFIFIRGEIKYYEPTVFDFSNLSHFLELIEKYFKEDNLPDWWADATSDQERARLFFNTFFRWNEIYPYRFLDYREFGIWTLFLGSFLIAAVVISSQFVFIAIYNNKFYRIFFWHDPYIKKVFKK